MQMSRYVPRIILLQVLLVTVTCGGIFPVCAWSRNVKMVPFRGPEVAVVVEVVR